MEPRNLRQRSRLSNFRLALLIAASLVILRILGGVFCPLGALARAQTNEFNSARDLTVGVSVGGDLKGSEIQIFKLNVSPGQFVRVTVDKQDLYLSATLISLDRQALSEHISRRFGALGFSFVPESKGTAYLQISSLEKDTEVRHYQLRIEEVRAATPRDNQDAAASNAYADAEMLRAKWDQQSLRAAIVKYSEALAIWASIGDRRDQLQTLTSIGECHFILSEYGKGLLAYTEALSLSRSGADTLAELNALNDAGYVHIYMGENPEALRDFEQVLSYVSVHPDDKSIETRRRTAQALNNEGEVYYSLSERRKALDYFKRALAKWIEAADRSGEALANLNLGYTYSDLGDLQNASKHYNRSLTLWQAIGDSRGEALSRTAIGGLQTSLGEKQLALDYHQQALQAFQALGNYQGEAAAWNGMAQVYEDLNQPRAALDDYKRALELNERIGNRDFAALSRYYVGRAYQTMGDSEQALKDYSQSVQLSHQVGNRKVEAHGLRGIGTIYESYGQREKALQLYAQVLTLYERIGDRRWQARTLNRIGYVHEGIGDKRKALSYYRHALSLSHAVEDRREEVSTLYNMAHAERGDGNLDKALVHISSGIGLIESLRMKVVGEQLRTSYFASVHQYYELYIDLLMQAHQRNPKGGFVTAALLASESARARSLLETLSEQKGSSGPGLNQDLLGRERTVWQQLNFKLEAQARLLNGQHTESEAAAGEDEIQSVMAAYQGVLDRIKEESPIYASLTQPELLRAESIQAEVGQDTVLLEYALGEERSYLWVVTPSSIESYELPSRAAIEKLTREVYDLVTARQPVAGEELAQYRRRVETSDANYWPCAAELSQALLGKVASQITGKRLLIVGDGVLHRVPFDALPEPSLVRAEDGKLADDPSRTDFPVVPLLIGHEVVTVPSASVLSALQSGRPAPTPALRLVAVFADPVFDLQDSRVDAPSNPPAAEPSPPEEVDLSQALRDTDGTNKDPSLPRLSSSLRESDAIEELTPSRERLISTGFDANLERVMGGDLNNFRIIHFATHGLFDDEHPELSGLILSRVDQNGRRRNGFLRMDDIYNLHLNADLVVLSACRTGLGRHVNGEGILGITRGFMYAGSRSVIASLWKVNDEATAELMKHFYSAMFRDGLRPSAALRAAKEAMWKQERWRSPYFWGAWVMQGNYNQSPAMVVASTHDYKTLVAVAISLPVLGLVVLLAFRFVRRRKSRHA